MNDFSVFADIYVWSGGVSGEPGEVLAPIPGIASASSWGRIKSIFR